MKGVLCIIFPRKLVKCSFLERHVICAFYIFLDTYETAIVFLCFSHVLIISSPPNNCYRYPQYIGSR